MPETLQGIDWDAIKLIYVTTNETLAVIGERFNISHNTLKTRAARGDWTAERKSFRERTKAAATRSKVSAKISLAKKKPIRSYEKAETQAQVVQELPTAIVSPPETLGPVETTIEEPEDSWEQRQLEARNAAWKVAHKKLKQADLPAPRTWKDAEIADRIQRKAAGLEDSDGPKVNVSVNIAFLNGSIK